MYTKPNNPVNKLAQERLKAALSEYYMSDADKAQAERELAQMASESAQREEADIKAREIRGNRITRFLNRLRDLLDDSKEE